MLRGITVTRILVNYRKKVNSLQTQLRRTKKALSISRAALDALKTELKVSQAKTCDCRLLTPAQQAFVASQARSAVVPRNGRRYTPADKVHAIRILLTSSAAYEVEKALWKFPHKNTLLRMVRPMFSEVKRYTSGIDFVRN